MWLQEELPSFCATTNGFHHEYSNDGSQVMENVDEKNSVVVSVNQPGQNGIGILNENRSESIIKNGPNFENTPTISSIIADASSRDVVPKLVATVPEKHGREKVIPRRRSMQTIDGIVSSKVQCFIIWNYSM